MPAPSTRQETLTTVISATLPDARAVRFPFIDLVKGVAILAMVIYHTGFDLTLQQLIAIDLINDPWWTAFAWLIAGTFVGLVGFNLVLATRAGFHPRRYFRRLGLIVGAAAIVSAGTWWFDARTFVFFGILHQIALASVLGLAFVRVPTVLVALVAAFIFAVPWFFEHQVFDAPLLWWAGLSATDPISIDYVPLFPWFGVALAGMVAARIFLASGTQTALAGWAPGGRLARAGITAGRWTLPIYLIHQPILFGIIFLVAPFIPPNVDLARDHFTIQCSQQRCPGEADNPTCTAFCTCLFEGIFDTDLYSIETLQQMTEDQRQRLSEVHNSCTVGAPPAPN